METKTQKKAYQQLIKDMKVTHGVWRKFSNWLVRKYGRDLHGKWEYLKINGKGKRKKTIRHRSFNHLELSKRLAGYDVMCAVEKFVAKSCPEIKIIYCDDSVYAGSNILLIPHPKHGITVMFIPQCTDVQNQFFLYENHYKHLLKELKAMNSVYKTKT